MRTLGMILAVVVIAVLGAWAIGLVDFGMSGGKLPDVEVTEGETPEISATTGSVEVGSEKKTIEVEVPKVEVQKAPDAQPEADAEAAAEAQEEAAEEQN